MVVVVADGVDVVVSDVVVADAKGIVSDAPEPEDDEPVAPEPKVS